MDGGIVLVNADDILSLLDEVANCWNKCDYFNYSLIASC